MITYEISGFKTIDVKYLVFDYNGTLAINGILIEGVESAIQQLAKQFEIFIVTADTFGTASKQLKGLPVHLHILGSSNQAEAKKSFIEKLGKENVIAVGNGRNDRKMVETSAIGIVVIQNEGASSQTLMASDIVCNTITDVFGIIQSPQMLTATLRG